MVLILDGGMDQHLRTFWRKHNLDCVESPWDHVRDVVSSHVFDNSTHEVSRKRPPSVMPLQINSTNEFLLGSLHVARALSSSCSNHSAGGTVHLLIISDRVFS